MDNMVSSIFLCSNNQNCLKPYSRERGEELSWRCEDCGSLIVPLYYYKNTIPDWFEERHPGDDRVKD